MTGEDAAHNNQMEGLLDPSLLQGLNEEQKKEALAAAAAAKRAEERAEQRALERALREKEARRRAEDLEQNATAREKGLLPQQQSATIQKTDRVVYVPKRKRMQTKSSPEEESTATKDNASAKATPKGSNGSTNGNGKRNGFSSSKSTATSSFNPQKQQQQPSTQPQPGHQDSWLSEKELISVKESYLGKSAEEREQVTMARRKKQRTSKKKTFKFRWEDEEDTFDDNDPLYNMTANGKPSAAASQAARPANNRQQRGGGGGRHRSGRDDAPVAPRRVEHKPLEKMTTRDWRILRENYEITVKGGKAPPPMRSFAENPSPQVLPDLHPVLLDAIKNVMKFQEPSPIQRQAIPIGLQRRDLIGIAETGSGKTVAFGVPLCHYLLHLPARVLNSVASEGPLALIVAPTRELALQIDGELHKLLSRQNKVTTGAVVGGQPIQQQAQMIRDGIHILVGTPGRINECIEMVYLVLNQCCYLVLDEGDRMIDMGFAPQIESILEAMGGALKSQVAQEAYTQEQEDLHRGDVAHHRVTALFSATMPMEVERMAKQYLRHPAVVSIGDEDSVKNARITQRVIFVSSVGNKEKALREQLNDPRFLREKVIVFVNEKKHADQVGRMVERSGRACVVMHGGKSQEQREENLETFRKGGIVMVATDVAGRGLDIPDVAHVINFDLPTRSIENYTHRIGRTGRAGKQGFATSFITDEDEGIMAPLKSYLESTGNVVPDRLARHPAANQGPAGGNLIY